MSKKTIKKLLLAGLIISVVSFIPFDFSHAQALSGIAGNLAESFVWILGKALYLVGYAFSKLTYVGGLILNWALALNANIGDNPAAQIGWKITRDFTNLGFVLLIIIIAFSTILRIADFQAKKVLPKLIAAALLINFSIIIATFLLDGAGIFTNYFLQKGFLSGSSTNGNEVGISQAIAGTLSLGAILGSPSPEFSSSLLEWGPGIVKYITDIVFIDIMTAIGAITIWTMAFMFLVRYVYIGFLLILMPGAILMWVIGNKNWGGWLDKFIKYTFFGPIASFFVFLALSTSTKMEGLVLGKLINSDDVTGIATQFADKAASMIMMVFLLMGGLMAAESLSIMGAKTGLETANGAMKFIGKATGKLASSPFRYGSEGFTKAMGAAAKSKKPWLQNIGQGYQRFQEGSARTAERLKKVTEFGGKSSIKSVWSTAMDEMVSPLPVGYKARHYDESLDKKRGEEKDKTAKRVKILDKYKSKGFNEALIRNTIGEAKDLDEADQRLKQISELADKTKVNPEYASQQLKDNYWNSKDTKGKIEGELSSAHSEAVKENEGKDEATKKRLEGERARQKEYEESHKGSMPEGFPRT